MKHLKKTARKMLAWLKVKRLDLMWGTAEESYADIDAWVGRFVRNSPALKRDCPDAMRLMRVKRFKDPLMARVTFPGVHVCIFPNRTTGALEVDTRVQGETGKFFLWESADYPWENPGESDSPLELLKHIGRAMEMSQDALDRGLVTADEGAGTFRQIVYSALIVWGVWATLCIVSPVPA